MPYSASQSFLDDQQAASGSAEPQQNSTATISSSEDLGTYIQRRSIPFYSAARNFLETREYTAAKDRVSSGRPQGLDEETVTKYEAQQRRDESRGVGGQILSAVANIPALVGETVAGGAVLGRLAPALSTASTLSLRGAGRIAATTALAPSFYLQQAAQRAQENGGQWYEPQNLGVAGAMGMAQMAVLEALPNFSRGITGNSGRAMAARLGIGTATGMGGQQIVDVIGGVVDEILPQAYQTRTRYGLMGDAMRGEWGHAWQHAAVQAVTFAAFSALHARGAKPAEPVKPGDIPEASPLQLPKPASDRLPVDVPLPGDMPPPIGTPSSIRMPSGFEAMPLARGNGIIEAWAKAANEKTLAGKDKVGNILSRVTKTIEAELAKKGALSPEDAKALIDSLKVTGAVKAYAETLIEASSQLGTPGRPLKSDKEVLGRERPKPGEIPADLLSRSRPALDQLADPEPQPIPRVPDPRDAVGAAAHRPPGYGPERPNTLGVRGNVALRPGEPVHGPELPPGGVAAPFTRQVTSSPPPHPLAGEREATRGARAGSIHVPIPPEMLTRSAPPVAREPSGTARPGFHAEKGAHFNPKDEVAQAMLAKRMPIKEAPAAPPPRPEPAKAPTPTQEPQKTAAGQPKKLLKPEKAPPPDREAVHEALARHLSGDPAGLADAAKLGNLTPEEAKVFGDRLTVGKKPSFDALGAELGVSHEQSRLLEAIAIEKLGLSVSVDKAQKIAQAGGKQERAAGSAADATGSGGARPFLEERLSEHLNTELERAKAAGQPIDPIVQHYAELSKVELRKEVVSANQKLLEAGEKPLTAQDHEYISKLAKGEEVAPFAAYLEQRPAEPVKPKRGPGSRLSTASGAAESRAAEPITPERVKAVADLSPHHAAVLKKLQGIILSSNVPTAKKMEYMNNQLRILSEMPATAAALHSANMKQTEFHASIKELTSEAAKVSAVARAVQAAGEFVGGMYDRGSGKMMLDGGTTEYSGPRLAGHETGHAIDGRNETISNSLDVQQAYLTEGLKGTIGEYARNSTQEFLAETLGLVYSGEMTPADLKAKMPLMYEAMVSRDLIRRAEGASNFTKPADIFDKSINDGTLHGDVTVRLHRGESERVSQAEIDEVSRYLENGTYSRQEAIDYFVEQGVSKGKAESMVADLMHGDRVVQLSQPEMDEVANYLKNGTYTAAEAREYLVEQGMSESQARETVHDLQDDGSSRLRTVPEESTPEKAMEKARALERLGGVLTNKWQQLGASMWEGAKSTLENWNQFSGKSFVKTTAIDRLSGEAMGRFAGVQGAVDVSIPDFVDLIAGKNATPEMMHRQYAAMLEFSARHAKKQFGKLGHNDKAAEVTTFIAGQENSNASSPFKSEQDFQAFRNTPEGKRAEAAYKEHFVPELEADYRSYKGMKEEEEIKGVAQIPDMPINFMRVDPETLSNSPFYMGGPGNLKNPKAGKLSFDQTATRAHSYETDMVKGLTNSLGKTKALAAKKAMYDRFIESGLAERGPKGGGGQLKNGDKVWELTDVFSNRDSLYVSERIKPELQQLLNLDSKFTIPIASEFAKIANRSMGAGFVETVSHLKNMATSLMGAGVNPLDLVPNAIKVVRGDTAINKKILELAKINAYRGGGLESGQLWGGKSDPTSWLSKLIHILDTSARLTLQSGYERNVRMGRTTASETGLRNFVNQGLGDYNKLSQHKVIKWLRDTGIGPFATAGTKFYTSAARLLVGDPNFTATSYKQAALARAEIFAKLAVVVGAVAVANKALWKNIWGDDDTPFGAIKTGKTADGKTTYLDLTAFTGLTRGMRQVGLLALTEGLRQGSSPQRIADKAAESFYSSLLHPMEGPVISFAHTMITGRDTFGRDVVPPESAGGSRALESVRAAAIQANPLTAATLGHDKRAEDMTFGARAINLLGPFNPFKERGDQTLGELHGRLRELTDLRRAFFMSPENTSRPFAREAEYRVLKRFDEAVGKLNDVISGTTSTQQGRRAIARPEAGRIRELRQQITDLARQAMQTQRQYQTR